MKKIDLNTYKLYWKYNGQAEWENDSRCAKPKDVYENIGIDFEIIGTITNNLFTIKSGLYSNELMKEMQNTINELKTKLTDEVYEYIERDEKIYPEPKSSKNIFQRLFG